MKTLDDLLGACRLDDGGHWIYALSPKADQPRVWAPDYTHDPSGKTLTAQGLRRAAWHLKHRRPIPAGHKIYTHCLTHRCVRPACLRCMTDAERGAFVAGMGLQKGLVSRRVATALSASVRRKLSDADVSQIRASREPVDRLAQQYSVSQRTILTARSGQARRGTNFFSGLLR